MSDSLKVNPPQWPWKLLGRVLRMEYLEEIQGDMEEVFHDNLEHYSLKKARRLYLWDAVKLMRPALLQIFKERQILNRYGMFQNNIKIAFRVFRREKIYTFINVLGMATGLAIALLIFQYAAFELSYESHNPNADRVARITIDYLDGETLVDQDCETYPPLGPRIAAEIPEVATFSRAYQIDEKPVLNVGESYFREGRLFAVDPDFFEIMGYPLLHGNVKGIFRNPFEAVINQSTALKYFQREDVVGETLVSPTLNQSLKVVGVIEDSPHNTHLKVDVLISYPTMKAVGIEEREDNWNQNNSFLYVMLNASDLHHRFAERLKALNLKLREEKKLDGEWVITQPVADVHLYSKKSFEPEPNGDANAVFFLLGVAILVIVIAIVNYINLATAKSLDRAKEVGIRKVLGSSISQLRVQFVTEAILISLFAGALALGLISVFMDQFKLISGLPPSIDFFVQPFFWLTLIGVLLISALLAGVFPAFVLSSFKPVSVLKGKFINSKTGVFIRKGLVVFQFGITLFLLIQTLTAEKQLEHMRQVELGFDMEQTIVVRSPHTQALRQNFTAFKDQLLNRSEFETVTLSNTVPGQPANEMSTTTGINPVDALESRNFNFYVYWIDEDFLHAMGMELAAGENFLPNSENANMLIVNEETVRLWGYETPEAAVGQKVTFWEGNSTILGVVRNFHQASAKSAYLPLLFVYDPQFNEMASIRTRPGDIVERIALVKQIYEENFPTSPFEYFFMDQEFDKQYRSDEQFQKVFGTLTSFAVLIACLGLFGLVTFTISTRTKEIGIRKVLGAGVARLSLSLSRDFMLLILTGICISLPFSYFVVESWLQQYAFRIQISWWLFLAPAIVVLLLSLVTILGKIYRICSGNPVNSLRDE